MIDALADAPQRFILFYDDLSFEPDDASYKVLKGVLDGSIFAATDNVLICRDYVPPSCTGSRAENLGARHDARGEVHPGETTEKISLSDGFGIWVIHRLSARRSISTLRLSTWCARWRRAPVPVAWDDAARSDGNC